MRHVFLFPFSSAILYLSVICLSVVVLPQGKANGQDLNVAASDTVSVSLSEFLSIAAEHSNELRARKQSVELARNRNQEARNSRIVPNFTLTTAHGLIPGVRSRDGADFPSSQLYLDPSLRNDWEDWAFFNQFEITALQPVYTWGAIRNAIKASQAGINVSLFEYQAQEQEVKLQLFQLWQGKLLAMELERLTVEAERTIELAERELIKLLDEGSDEIDDADFYQFEIFKFEFQAQQEEVRRNIAFLERAWAIALGSRETGIVYVPEDRFLDPIDKELDTLDSYVMQAMQARPEVLQIESVRDAAGFGLEAQRAQRFPALFLGATYRYAYAPNRPRQRNPFISNPANTESLTVGLGLRQNLNFFQLQNRTERSQLQFRQASYALDAVRDGIELDVSDKYKDVRVASKRLSTIEGALDVSRNWLRQEQLDYDIGFGDIPNLIDAFTKNLELEAQQKQYIHDFNVRLARLLNAGGFRLDQIFTN
ncbi:Outer membrane protein TolC [Cyclonatronum proteinivorum]|uniref:Outer membrane protein TolC n=1 Tax=Cyclonatronum proteinivorum TaxID=1457365 RepID=A0A345UJ21_9BACT|nr:TolC family protein [Cyclonatronum proteinivorum]AXJ00473.1 Outer membrane protein TolC [Cyclonatronum proteinivorum]